MEMGQPLEVVLETGHGLVETVNDFYLNKVNNTRILPNEEVIDKIKL